MVSSSSRSFSLAKLQEIIRQNSHLSPADLQAQLNVPEADIMLAMAEEAVEIPATDLDALLQFIRGWGEVMSLIRNQDAVSELKFQASTLYRRGDWLNSIDPAYNLHIRIVATRRILLLIRANHRHDSQTSSVNFVNQAGSVFWRVYVRAEADQAGFNHLIDLYKKDCSLPPVLPA